MTRTLSQRFPAGIPGDNNPWLQFVRAICADLQADDPDGNPGRPTFLGPWTIAGKRVGNVEEYDDFRVIFWDHDGSVTVTSKTPRGGIAFERAEKGQADAD